MKVVVSGGGTGGHTLPVIAVIRSLEKIDPKTKIVFIGSRFGVESNLIPKLGVKFYGISTGKFRRYHKSMVLNLVDPTTLIKNIKDLVNFIKGISEARRVLIHEKPDIIFAKGGYVSLPVGYAARLLKIPLIIHESDTIMGLANQKMSKFAQRVCVSFPKKFYPDIKSEKLIETGNPVREDLVKAKGYDLKKRLGFDPNRKTVLVIGGSQGSHFINQNISAILNELLLEYQLIWIAGENDFDQVNFDIKELDEEKRKYVKAYSFITSDLAEIYDASDVVISRSGSNVIFELAYLRKPMILIPIEDIAGGHQFENAKYFSRNGAAFTLSQKTLTPKKLLHQIRYIFENPQEINNMKENAYRLSHIEAADEVAAEIIKLGNKKHEQIRESKEK